MEVIGNFVNRDFRGMIEIGFNQRGLRKVGGEEVEVVSVNIFLKDCVIEEKERWSCIQRGGWVKGAFFKIGKIIECWYIEGKDG